MNKPRGGGGVQLRSGERQSIEQAREKDRERERERKQAVEKNREQVRKQARGGGGSGMFKQPGRD